MPLYYLNRKAKSVSHTNQGVPRSVPIKFKMESCVCQGKDAQADSLQIKKKFVFSFSKKHFIEKENSLDFESRKWIFKIWIQIYFLSYKDWNFECRNWIFKIWFQIVFLCFKDFLDFVTSEFILYGYNNLDSSNSSINNCFRID